MNMSTTTRCRFFLESTCLLMCFSFARAFGDDCIVLTGRRHLCGKIELETENLWSKNKVTVDDSIEVSLRDVHRLSYGGDTLLRATAGAMLSDFAVLKQGGRLSLYEKRESFQSGSRTFYSARPKYFSLDDDTLFYFNLKNLDTQIRNSPASEQHLRRAYMNKWVAVGIRVASAVPFLIGIRETQEEQRARYLVPFGIGAAMLTIPAFTLKPAMRKDIDKAIKSYNDGEGEDEP